MTNFVTRENYKGWLVDHDHPPIPFRNFDWTATHSSYDLDGPDASLLLEAATRDELFRMIDTWTDDRAVDAFAEKMKAKMAASRAKGREGWDDPARCSPDTLVRLMYAHADKGDPVDVANYCMMLDHYGASTSMGDAEPAVWLHIMRMEHDQFDQHLSFCKQHPWGTPGVHYSEEYLVESYPLFPINSHISLKDREL